MNEAIRQLLEQATVDPVVAGCAVGVSRSAAYRAVRDGSIPAFKVGHLYRCPTEPLLQRLGLSSPEARAAALCRVRDEQDARQGGSTAQAA